MTNGQVNKGFARGAICWMNGDNLDWAKYVIYYGKYATKLRETKATNLAWQLESDGVCEVKQAPRPPTCRHVKVEYDVVDVEVLIRKGVQVLSEE